jgi:hypothetical protein
MAVKQPKSTLTKEPTLLCNQVPYQYPISTINALGRHWPLACPVGDVGCVAMEGEKGKFRVVMGNPPRM